MIYKYRKALLTPAYCLYSSFLYVCIIENYLKKHYIFTDSRNMGKVIKILKKLLAISALFMVMLVISCQNSTTGNVVIEKFQSNLTNEYSAEIRDFTVVNAESNDGYELAGSMVW